MIPASRRIFVTIFLGAVFSPAAYAAPRLYGASETSNEHWPAVSAVFASDKSASKGFIATAMLVHPKFIVTAAHSVEGLKPDDVVCAVGEHFLSEADAAPLRIVDIIIHPDYVGEKKNTRFQADIALLRLATPVTDIVPMRVFPSLDIQDAEGQEAIIIGWAGDAQSATRRDYRLELAMPSVSLDAANAEVSYNGAIQESMLPLGTAEMSSDSCLEASSAPIVFPVGEEYHLIGLTSFGDGCRKRNKYHIATDLRAYATWISSLTGSGPGEIDFGLPEGYGATELVERLRDQNTIELKYPQGTETAGPIAEISYDLSNWARIDPADVQVSTAGDAVIWSARVPDATGPARFLRFASLISNPSDEYVPAPKPIVNNTTLSGEIIGADDVVAGRHYQRDYLITRLPEGSFLARVFAEMFGVQMNLLDPATGEILHTQDAEPGIPVSVAIEGGREYVLRISTEMDLEEARFQIAVTPAANGQVTPEKHEITAQLGSEPDPLTVRIANNGGGVLDFQISTDRPWIELEKDTGSVDAGKAVNFRVTIHMDQITSLGVHSGEVMCKFANDAEFRRVEISLSVTPAGERLTVGQPIVAQLDSDDELSTFRWDLRMDRYIFTAPVPGLYLFSMGSNVIDPFLYLLTDTGEYITEADDRGLGAVYNAGIVHQMAAGDTVLIEATCYGPWGRFRALGPYQIVAVKISD